jgi:hypothetical protein
METMPAPLALMLRESNMGGRIILFQLCDPSVAAWGLWLDEANRE